MNTKIYSFRRRLYGFSGLTLSSLGLAGCAGPNTPLGAVWSLTTSPAIAQNGDTVGGPRIRVTPSRQILHGPSSVRLTIEDPTGDLRKYDLTVRYNGFDVSRAFAQQSRFQQDFKHRTLTVENPTVRLPATSEHLIEFAYHSSNGNHAYTRFESPTCFAFRPGIVTNTLGFRPSPRLLEVIARAAREEGFNPAFFTGLIAQESRFRPQSVSWAKAVGLTQITSAAEQEVAESHSDWPRYPGIADMPVDQLKILILGGVVNSSNEWRLDSRLSVRGGMEYARLLGKRWTSQANLERVRQHFADPEMGVTQLILASYHSGYTRVSMALDREGKNWLKARELKEARNYVNRIFSYCNHFTSDEVSYAQAS